MITNKTTTLRYFIILEQKNKIKKYVVKHDLEEATMILTNFGIKNVYVDNSTNMQWYG